MWTGSYTAALLTHMLSGLKEKEKQICREKRSKVRGGERQEQETGETEGGGPAQREAPGESQGKRHRGTGAGAEQREITEASGQTRRHFGHLRKKTNGAPNP